MKSKIKPPISKSVLIKFLAGEAVREDRLAEQELAVLDGSNVSRDVALYRRREAKRHERRAELFRNLEERLVRGA